MHLNLWSINGKAQKHTVKTKIGRSWMSENMPYDSVILAIGGGGALSYAFVNF